MLLGGFSLELLVDGKLLKEYNESVDKRTTTTGVSYVLDQKTGEKIESDQTYYAAVDQLDKNYEILFGAKKELFTMGEQSSAISFRTKIYVDGQLDRSLRLINKAVKIKKDGFIGEKRKKTALMFDLSKWMENDDESIEKGETQNNDSANNFLSKRNDTKEDIKNDNDDDLSNEKKPDQSKFGYGAVSVYFFNAKDFDKNETATGNPIPLAALHLHYRPTQWLLARDILAKEEPNEIFDEAQIIKEVDDTVQKTVQQVKLHPAHPGKNKDMNQEPDDDDCDISEWTGKLDLSDAQEVVEESQGTKKKSRGKKEKKNVEKVKNEMEEPVDNDSDKGKSIPNDTQEVIEENQGAKKKSRGRKEKKNVEKVKNEMEESADNNSDKEKDDVQEVDEENQGTKKKSRGKKEKRNVEKVKNEMEESVDNDCDKGKEDVQEVDEENQGTKKKSRGKKEKKNVEKVEKSVDNDCDISELTEKLTLDDAQQTVEEKKKSRDKKKKNVENVPVNRYNLRPRK
ncbi:hypothetical protein RhiirA5_499575 [Rhizophagus irregularis]|uniref:Uncharacterized protein n=1 Tax=Rhizophagus irregularis TaxID=588596 RepID=A0A2I1EJT7_9GLOM|nr:hypothetical protein RhiirA5_499575 [Rhizophagus irregularis]PKC70023.1 hypothetical protein RhiirA1_533002 [Rhizophagus irregularis]PKY22390.1 hypothetical protein RhiirB3_525740 [Rhizophagus irregularis]CAB4488446.1 unnamed protein product [Rhizophagus irregularis]CAB5197632.1 unnamed protein product [Rhizophagus irregularis]